MHSGKIVPPIVSQFVRIYAAAIACYTTFRAMLLFTERTRVDETVSAADVLRAFVMGVRFDIVIAGYILAVPFLVLAIASFFNRNTRGIRKGVFCFATLLFTLSFVVCAVDIPFFNHFFSRLSVSLFEWFDSPAFVAKMVVEEPRYWLAGLPGAGLIFLFARNLYKILVEKGAGFMPNTFWKAFSTILFLGLMLLGIRGRLDEKSPIRVGTANFSNNAFLNQLGLNPNFTLIRSYLDSRKPENKRVNLLDDAEAVANVQQYLGITPGAGEMPFVRHITGDSARESQHNVVIVIMESMSAGKMARHGNPHHLTPFLDSLSHQGYYFENAYSAGIHTFNGIFSTLFSYPALFRQHPMKESSRQQYQGAFSTLRQHGYSTAYFTTHDGQFDNVEGFLRGNDCEMVVAKPDYPAEQVKTTLGVPDDFMFEFSIPVLNNLYQKNKPFVAAFMTASDHGPYYIPPYFKPSAADVKQQIVQYADFSLHKFMTMAAQQPWFSNTIFVFVADHGAALDGVYDMALDYNHIPLLFYAPAIIREPKTFSAMAGQIDAFPTVMGLLNLPYTNTTLGIDLLKEKRPYIFCNADDKFGVLDPQWFLVVRNDNSKSLYKYRTRDTRNYATENDSIVRAMELYAKSNMQAFQYVIKQK